MITTHQFSRRALLGAAAAVPFASLFGKAKAVPIGLELYSVRDELKKNLPGTLKAVANMGYECVEFFAPYYDWTPENAKDVRKQLDDLKLKCYSTHNGMESFSAEGLGKAIELNKILGTHYIVLAHPGDNVQTLDDWKRVVNVLNTANHRMSSDGLRAAYHNHDLEWKPVDGQKPIELIAANTNRNIMLQLDVGTCLAAGSDPVAWIQKNPGRIKSIHLKEWSPEKGYRVLFGEGVAPWKKIFAAAESAGGVEFYLIEQEGSDYPELETADRCLVAYRNLHG
jgi:sugar phosphate isomerase/epimerase